ncbi:MAG: AIR synthase related protein, partial [Candidatus Tectomicrobia bacterium]|nr:AIR synthase related protein [Candidatus Tectomicrobia bacterium]
MRPEPATQGITTFHSLTCPLPITDYDAVLLGHGSGGRLSSRLLHDVFLPAFDNPLLAPLDDQAVLDVEGTRLAFTTDAFVVDPLFFPGGNIGHLAVNGTINDLCVGGAHPLYISAAFILEEGFRVDDLRQIVLSMRQAADAAGVHVVTGDTKVVNRGCADKLFITTSG